MGEDLRLELRTVGRIQIDRFSMSRVIELDGYLIRHIGVSIDLSRIIVVGNMDSSVCCGTSDHNIQ